MSNGSINLWPSTLVLLLSWSFFMALTTFWEMQNIQSHTVASALIQARIAYDKDLSYRQWNAVQGGVYAEVSESTPPNPHLIVVERDIVTASGRKLTLINPAYMTRMIHERDRAEKDGIQGHITSLDPINPGNEPDEWEKEALRSFSKEEDVYYSVEDMAGQSYLRYMKPFMVVPSCLKCHAQQGYDIGDVRGALSVSVPMASLQTLELMALKKSFLLHASLWFLGILGLAWERYRMVRQLTRQQRVEKELSKAKYTLDQIHDCVFVFRPDTLQFSYVNEGACKQVGYLENELLAMTPLDIKPDFTEESFRKMLEPLLEEAGLSLVFETGHLHKDGSLVPVEIKLQFLKDEGRGRFVAVARDLTQRHKEQKEYRRLFEASRDAIVVTTQNGFVECNQAALEMFEYDNKDEFLQLHPADVSPEKQPDGTPSLVAARQHINNAMEHKAAFFPWLHCRKDGSEFPAEVLLSSFEHNGEKAVQGVVRDITERHKADKDKERMQAKLLQAQKLESVGQLAAGIAHEINTPTQYVGTNLDFLDEAMQDMLSCMTVMATIGRNAPPEIAAVVSKAFEDADWDYLAREIPQSIEQSKDGIQRVSTIVRAMKEFSHPGSKEPSPIDINHLIQTTVNVARNEWKYVADMELNLDESLPRVLCLSAEMGQVFLNLLVNGAHSIADKLGENPEGQKGLLQVSSTHDGQQVQICIADSGNGIPQDIQDRVFDPFFTTKSVGKGTGQGLAIAHDVVVEKHGGSLSFETEAGAGSTFIITIPLMHGNTEGAG